MTVGDRKSDWCWLRVTVRGRDRNQRRVVTREGVSGCGRDSEGPGGVRRWRLRTAITKLRERHHGDLLLDFMASRREHCGDYLSTGYRGRPNCSI